MEEIDEKNLSTSVDKVLMKGGEKTAYDKQNGRGTLQRIT